MSRFEDKQQRMWRRAYELARSGKFSNWITIEWELRFNEGFPEARLSLDDPFVRIELDALCAQSVSSHDNKADADNTAKAISAGIQDVQVRVVAQPTEFSESEPENAVNEVDEQELRILIVEDNLINQKVVIGLLSQVPCQYDVVENGAEAIAALMRSPYDIVLMDMQMPVMDGVTATKEIRLLGDPISKIPIIAITADAMTGDREKYLAAGVDDYVAKPIDSEQLFTAIGRHTGQTVSKLETQAPSAVA
jgi:CheY-like chemotaxis protein